MFKQNGSAQCSRFKTLNTISCFFKKGFPGVLFVLESCEAT